MVKYSLDFKLHVVKDYFDNNLGVNYLTKKYHLPTHTKHYRKYLSFRGHVGKIAPNILKQHFNETKPLSGFTY